MKKDTTLTLFFLCAVARSILNVAQVFFRVTVSVVLNFLIKVDMGW